MFGDYNLPTIIMITITFWDEHRSVQTWCFPSGVVQPHCKEHILDLFFHGPLHQIQTRNMSRQNLISHKFKCTKKNSKKIEAHKEITPIHSEKLGFSALSLASDLARRICLIRLNLLKLV